MQTLKIPRLKTLAVGTKEIARRLYIMRDFNAARNFYTTISQFKNEQ